MSRFIQSLQDERAALLGQFKEYPELELELAHGKDKLKTLLAIDRKKIHPDELKEAVGLDQSIIEGTNKMRRLASENLDTQNRINEIDRLLQSKKHLEEATDRQAELESELADLERTAKAYEGGIERLEAIKADVTTRLQALANAGGAALLATVGLGSADVPAPKQSAIAGVQHEMQAVISAIESACKSRDDHAFHVLAVRHDLGNVTSIIAHARCDVLALEHAHALGEYLAVLARLRGAERAIGQWAMPIRHEELAQNILMEAEGY